MRFTHLPVRRSHRGSCSVTAPDLAEVGRLPGKAEAGAPGVDPALGLPHPTPQKTVALWPSVCVADVMSVFPRDRRNCQSVFLTCATAPICDSSQKQSFTFSSRLCKACAPTPTQHLQRELPPATQMPFLTPTWVTSQGLRVASPFCERCQQRCRGSHSVSACMHIRALNRAQKAPEPDALRMRCRCVSISRMRRMPKMHDP